MIMSSGTYQVEARRCADTSQVEKKKERREEKKLIVMVKVKLFDNR